MRLYTVRYEDSVGSYDDTNQELPAVLALLAAAEEGSIERLDIYAQDGEL